MPRVVLEQVTKCFAAPNGVSVGAVKEVSLALADRELLTLVGPSGCGKTTLLRLIAGLEPVTQGTIAFDGKPVQAHPPQARNVAMVFQSHALFPHLTAWENIAFGLKIRGVAPGEIIERVHATAEMLGVIPCLHRPPAALSGGERQRIALGRALVRRPQILLLDEPLSNLDPPLRAQLRGEIQTLHARLGLTIIYVTHDQAEALALGDRVAVMEAGRLQQVASPREIYAAPANRFVAGFVGSPAMNFFPGTITQRDGIPVFIGPAADFVLRLEGVVMETFGRHRDRSVLLGLRPEHLALADSSRSEASHPALPATLKAVEFGGPEAVLHFNVGQLSFHVRTGPNPALKPGQSALVGFDLRRGLLFDAATGGLLA